MQNVDEGVGDDREEHTGVQDGCYQQECKSSAADYTTLSVG